MFGKTTRRRPTSKGFEAAQEAHTTFSDPNAKPAAGDQNDTPVETGDENPKHPFTAGEVRKAFGFDPNDESVKVNFIPLGRGTTDDAADLDHLFADIRSQGQSATTGEETSGYRPGNVDPFASLRDIKSFERAAEDKALFGSANPNPYDGDTKLYAAIKKDPDGTLRRILSLNESSDSVTAASRDVIKEVTRAMVIHGPMKSAHEGYAVMLEELDELWAHVKANTATSPEARKEAVQIAAMAIRFIADVIEGDGI